MDQIGPHRLWVGHAGDGRNYEQLFAIGIEAVVQVAIEEEPLVVPRELVYLRFPVVDGGGNRTQVLRSAVTAVSTLIVDQIPTLVCCGAGMSRSPAIAAAGLAFAYRISPESCLNEVARYRRGDVSAGFWSEILEILTLLSSDFERFSHGKTSG
jgi:protein-tyrosine phosphatase